MEAMRTRRRSVRAILSIQIIQARCDRARFTADRSVSVLHACKTWFLLIGGCVGLSAEVAHARPDSYVPRHQWTKEAWRCDKAGKSSIEIESLRLPTSFITNLKVIELRINGRTIPSSSVKDLDAFVGTLDAAQTIAGFCGWTGEFVFIRGFVRGRSDPRATEERKFFIRYVR